MNRDAASTLRRAEAPEALLPALQIGSVAQTAQQEIQQNHRQGEIKQQRVEDTHGGFEV